MVEEGQEAAWGGHGPAVGAARDSVVAADTSGILNRLRLMMVGGKPPPPQPLRPTSSSDGGRVAAGDGQAPSQGAGGASSLSKQSEWRSRLLGLMNKNCLNRRPPSSHDPTTSGGASATTMNAGGEGADMSLGIGAAPFIAGKENQPTPVPPRSLAYRPVVDGTFYQQADFSGPWTLSSFHKDTTTLRSHQRDPCKGSNPTAYNGDTGAPPEPPDHHMTLDALEKAFDEAAATQDPQLKKVGGRYGSVPDCGVVVGGEEDEEEDERERPDPFIIDPVEATAEALNETFFKGLSWQSIQRDRPKIALYTNKYYLEDYGKPSDPHMNFVALCSSSASPSPPPLRFHLTPLHAHRPGAPFHREAVRSGDPGGCSPHHQRQEGEEGGGYRGWHRCDREAGGHLLQSTVLAEVGWGPWYPLQDGPRDPAVRGGRHA